MNVVLSEIKIYREPTVEKMKLRIKSMIWNIGMQQEGKPKKVGKV